MPIYEYRCDSCKEVSEFRQKFSDPPPEQCPQCSGSQLTKLLSQSSFVLKGSGWYVTDFKKSPKKPEPGQEKSVGSEQKETKSEPTVTDSPTVSDSPKEPASKSDTKAEPKNCAPQKRNESKNS